MFVWEICMFKKYVRSKNCVEKICVFKKYVCLRNMCVQKVGVLKKIYVQKSLLKKYGCLRNMCVKKICVFKKYACLEKYMY